jgi:plasmid maintenance system killer protein
MLNLIYAPIFLKQAGDFESSLQEEVSEKITLFKDKNNHKSLKVHKLHGPLKDRYSFSVNYKIRIVFRYLSKNEAVLLAVGDHDLYK